MTLKSLSLTSSDLSPAFQICFSSCLFGNHTWILNSHLKLKMAKEKLPKHAPSPVCPISVNDTTISCLGKILCYLSLLFFIPSHPVCQQIVSVLHLKYILWIKKMWYIYTMEYYSAIKKNEIMPFAATWMQLEIIILSEVSQKENDKYHMISLTCGI